MPSLLEIYEKKFKSLNVNKKPGIYTAGKAPHKPTLLLSIILLNRNNRMDLHNINTGLQLRNTHVRPKIWQHECVAPQNMSTPRPANSAVVAGAAGPRHIGVCGAWIIPIKIVELA